MANIFPGVSPVSGHLSGSEQAALRAVNLARQAADKGTFGVGGILANRNGDLVADALNAVIENGRIRDPTAHAERQLIDWYFEQRRQGLAAAPEDLVIVTSLDPCAMCAGAVLLGGFNCIAVAQDPVSGVHLDGMPVRMPQELRAAAQARMGFFGVAGGRKRTGANPGPLFTSDISPMILTQATAWFEQGLNRVRKLVGDDEGPPEFTLAGGAELSTLGSALPASMRAFPHLNSNRPVIDQWRELLADAHDRSLIVDRAGRVIAGAESAEDCAPTRSSLLELVRGYPELRRIAGQRLQLQLPHQRYCTIVKRGPAQRREQDMMELGAIGSLLEQPRPDSSLPALAFIELDGGAELSRIKKFAAALPPFYTEFVRVTVGPAPKKIRGKRPQ